MVLVLGLTATGVAAVSLANQAAARGYLMRQADLQLRSYARQLTSRPFTVFPGTPLAPGTSGASGSMLSVAVRDSTGQLLTRAGPPAPVRAASRGTWLVIIEPMHYQSRHIPFVYGAEDSSFSVTSAARPGSLAGTLVIALDVASIGQTTGRLARTDLAAGGLMLLLVACGAAWAIRRTVQPLANHTLSRAEEALAAMAMSEAAARGRAERLRQTVADTGYELRRPLSVLRGLAGYYRENRQLTPGDTDRLMKRVEEETARLQALVDQLSRPQPDPPPVPQAAPPPVPQPDPPPVPQPDPPPVPQPDPPPVP
jgi:signal transduction histidine kinase